MGTTVTDRRSRILGQARADLTSLPDLIDELGRCLTERPPISSGGGGKPGSKAPLRPDVLHLLDGRRKPGWEGEDPRATKYELSWNEGLAPDASRLDYSRVFSTEAAAWNAYDRLPPVQQERASVHAWANVDTYGVGPTLEQWTRVLCEEMDERPELAEHATVRAEASLLVEHWAWICEQQWSDELADQVTSLTKQVRTALGEVKEPHYTCPTCGAAMFIQGGERYMVCMEGHKTEVDNLAGQQRRRPAMSTKDIVSEYAITLERLYQWHSRKKIQPVRTEGRTLYWLPWDVFSLINPDIVEALDTMDAVAV